MCLSSSTIWGYWHHAAIRYIISSKCHTGMSTPFQVLKSPGMSVTSTMEVLWSPKNIHGKLGRLISHCVESILSISRKEIWPTKVLSVWWLPRWSFYKDNSHLRWKKSSGSNSSYSKEATLVQYLKKDILSVKVDQLRYIFVGWWNGDTYWDWLEAYRRVLEYWSIGVMEAVHCSCRFNCNTRHCHWKK